VVSFTRTDDITAGADIKEMQPKGFSEVYGGDFLRFWNAITKFDKPIIAAVNGFAVRSSPNQTSGHMTAIQSDIQP